MINVASGKGIYIGLGSLLTSMKDAPGIAVVRIEDPKAALQVCVVYTPFLQRAFSTESLRLGDWLRCTAVASSVLWLREIQKAVERLTRAQ